MPIPMTDHAIKNTGNEVALAIRNNPSATPRLVARKPSWRVRSDSHPSSLDPLLRNINIDR
jgi:hypothetical protein